MLPLAISLVLLATSATSAPRPAARTDPAAKERDREQLRKVMAGIIARTPLKDARLSVQVVSLDDGSVVFAQGDGELLNPASNVKLFTSAAALSKLGPDYRFETEFLVEPDFREARDGKARVLYVKGKGDPTMTTEKLYGAVSELIHAGLKEVGDVVLDESWFDTVREPPGFDQESGDRSYLAPPGALSLNWNAVGVYLRPGDSPGAKASVELEPDSEYFNLDAQLLTGSRTQRRFTVSSGLDKDHLHQKIEVRGFVPVDKLTWSVWKKIDQPALYFGYTLKALLKERGVKVKGRLRLGTAPNSARPLHIAVSDTLDIVLKRLDKLSSNFIAEQLVKTMGAEVKGAPGTTEKGIEVVEEYLQQDVGLSRGSYVMRNGSGLNDTNRFSASQVNRVLKKMWERFPTAPEYMSALGIAGKDGTVKYRFEGTDAVGRLRAKTGTLENVSALSGYVQAVGGERFVFSILVNDFAGRPHTVVQHIDALGAAVAAEGSARGPSEALASLQTASVVGPLQELEARMKTYEELGAKGDRRNNAFLRTAWRTERDPAVRALIAEALYLSDPREGASVRVLLDSALASEDVFGRLKRASQELKQPLPLVQSLTELGASGNTEAIGRLCELSRASAADDEAGPVLADALATVANESPFETLMVLRGFSTADRESQLEELAQGLVRAAQPDAPLWAELKALQGSPEPSVVDFARSVEVFLSQRIAEAKAPPMSDGGAVVLPGAPSSGSAGTPGGAR